MFTLELHRGPQGLGLALVDGMVRPPRLLHMLIWLQVSSSLSPSENSAEDERRLRQGGGSGFPRSPVPEAADG